MDRLQQKHELLLKLGALFGPILRIEDHPDEYNEQEKAEVYARFFADNPILIREFKSFTLGQPGRNYLREMHSFESSLLSLQNDLAGVPTHPGFNGQLYAEKPTKERILFLGAKASKAVFDVPVPETSVILNAGNPFTAYCKIKELCEADASQSIVWLDAYFGTNNFHRFLQNIQPGVKVTIVTEAPPSNVSGGNRTRWNDFLDISKLYAQERGAGLYQLVVVPSLHDRWLVQDQKRIYTLGGSAKDAGSKDYFTISTVDATPENLTKISVLLSSGTEWFGPSTPAHRTS